MTDRKRLSVNLNIMGYIRAGLAVLLCLLMLASCTQMNDAEKKVSAELKALQSSDSVGSEVINLRSSLSDEGKAHFDGFLSKLRDFDFEITGGGEPDEDGYTPVNVKIRTYDFGREYLAAWTEFLKSHGGEADEDDLPEFYELLFARLDALDEKEYIKDTQIVCIDPLGNGEWIADIKENEVLQDAVFGGMISEMKALAAE